METMVECGGYVVKYIKYLQVEYNECQPYIEGATVFSKRKEQFLDITNTYVYIPQINAFPKH